MRPANASLRGTFLAPRTLTGEMPIYFLGSRVCYGFAESLRSVVMKKQCVLAAILAGSLMAGTALAQHTAPKTQPPEASEPKAPTGELVLGTARLPRGVTADGKPLAAGNYQVKLT